jgi:hypothetical protein
VVNVTSSDLYLRIPLVGLNDLRLLHLHSEIDHSIVISPEIEHVSSDLRLRGYTEWIATFHGRHLSLGWDWYEMEPGALAILDPALLRTNVMLVNEQQRDVGTERTNICLLGLIRNTDWYTVVAEYLGLPFVQSKQS